ncbi:hypothetical protein J2790_003917 [Paenarthrobacter nicotinovorans]|uniref:ATP-dependent nuclease n=1 Tax=Micrococcaceae TaxID=1268 RepID=UPI0008770A02|nr:MULTISPECIES: AAA family ATPase [Micrococcaceae]MDR6438750.1 hypothetical protein [Paenarthrobacter nicotinovorans]SCZ56408.1 Predicted ATP-dependent endonuclease of the OLD family, contains P-loop ATPase and TOPRIM domains [Arthrobacter sp. UNCCL28]
MKLKALRVRNFRTVGPTDQTLTIGEGGTTLVGPNNTGKTNLLHAVELFFTGPDNKFGFTKARDLSFVAGSGKTSLVATFAGVDEEDHPDCAIFSAYDRLSEFVDVRVRDSAEFTLSLVMSPSDNPVYQFFPNAKKTGTPAEQTAFSRLQSKLVADLLGLFSVQYVPAAKTMDQLNAELLMPFMVKKVAETISPYVSEIESSLETVAGTINSALMKAGLAHFVASFGFPNNSLEGLLTGFDFALGDPTRTSIQHKGQGVQSVALLASLIWISEQLRSQGASPIWLLEEPESYLHPELSRSALDLVEQLRKDSTVLITTHALAFVPRNVHRISGVSLVDGTTRVDAFRNYREATENLSQALGVAFSDYFNLSDINVLVEGQSDKDLIPWAMKTIDAISDAELPLLFMAEFLDFGGVKHLSGFLRANYGFIRRERVAVPVFDGDEAGIKERRELQQYFGQKQIPFQSNQDYLSVRDRFAIEGLFPDPWVQDLHQEHPSWFEIFSEDSQGGLEPFKVKSSHKTSVINALCKRAELDNSQSWAGPWTNFLMGLEKALAIQRQRLEQDRASELATD